MIDRKLIQPLTISGSIVIIAILLPLVLFRIQDYYLLNKVEIQVYKSPNLIQLDEIDIKSRLSLICSYGSAPNITVTDLTQVNVNLEEYFNNVISGELKKLEEFKGIPKSYAEANYRVNYMTSQIYMNIELPSQYVQVNSVFLTSEDYHLNLLIDAVTNKIYELYVMKSKNLDVLDDTEYIGPEEIEGFGKYIGLQLEEWYVFNQYESLYGIDDTNINYLFEIYPYRLLYRLERLER